MRLEDFIDVSEKEIIETLMSQWRVAKIATERTIKNNIPWWSKLEDDRWLDYSIEMGCYEYIFKRFLTGGDL